MKNKLVLNELFSVTWLNFLLIIILTLGIFFRFANLDSKVYWLDETFTSLQVSGYLQSEVKADILDGREIGIDEIGRYQYPTADSPKTALDTIKGLISFEPQHTPFYFVLARYWLQGFGNSIATIRCLSVVASLLSILLVYLLCIELFENQLVGFVAAALLAVSPFHLVYAQEARPFSLWTTTILLSSLALLRAQRLQTLRSWFFYAVSIALGLYTFLFSLLVCLAHAVYIAFSEKFRFNLTVISYLIASIAGILAFFPWIAILISSREKLTNFASSPAGLLKLISKPAINFGFLVADFGLTKETSPIYFIPFLLLLVAIGGFFIYATYYSIFNGRGNARAFVLALIIVPFGILFATDIIQGNQRSLIGRYLIPSFLGLQIAAAYLIAARLVRQVRQQRFWQILIAVIFSISIVSDTAFVLAHKWPSKSSSNSNLDIAMVVNQSKTPLIVSDNFFINVFSLSYELVPQVKYQLTVEPADSAWREFPAIARGHDDVFAYAPSAKLIQTLRKRGTLTPVLSNSQGEPILWQFRS